MEGILEVIQLTDLYLPGGLLKGESPCNAPAKPLLKQLRLPSIAEMIRQESASMVYKAINGQAPTYLSL